MLTWNDVEVMAFFEVERSYDETCNSYAVEVNRDGLRLLVTIFDLACAIYVSIFRDGLPQPLFTVQREHCTHAQITEGPYNGRCFEAGSPRNPASNMGVPPVLERGVRVYVEPHFIVELIEPRYDELERNDCSS